MTKKVADDVKEKGKNRIVKKIILSIFFLMILSMAGVLGFFYYEVREEASKRIQRGAIERIIFSESPVYYDDEKNIIGVFFEKTHAKYLHFRDIPPLFIKALVASEDRHFFSHSGFDLRAMSRALIANIKEGRIVQGGSTITQQTAKNIFKREKRSYIAKLKELIQAFLLEKTYTKEEILEMYINQFFVTGFGRGLGIAAQYFFDKPATDLGLVESAFIAGSVKGPFQYDPFTKRTEAEKREAKKRAKIRKDYVLKKMLTANFITNEQYDEARSKEVPFNEGKITYRLNVLLDYVREQLESDFFRKILSDQGIENIATSGIKVYTAVDQAVQEGVLRSLCKHLPALDVQLSGYDREMFQKKYHEMAGGALQKPNDDMPFLCRVTGINMDNDHPYLVVSWDQGGGIIDYNGLESIGDAWLKGKAGQWAKFEPSHVSQFLKNLKIGDLVAVQHGPENRETETDHLELTTIPELEGGIVVMHKGMIKAMVGGFFNRFFNRAVYGKRQLGSIFKPLVYTAALKLKWHILDPLSNTRDLFQFESTSYMPRPDHTPESDKVSMLWAGVKSENLASVWLLYHLTAHLNMEEFNQIVEELGLSRKKGEAYEDYVKRIRDEHGIVVDEETIKEAAFEEAKKEIEPDLIFSGHEDAIVHLQDLKYRVPLSVSSGTMEAEEAVSRNASFERLEALNMEMEVAFDKLKSGHVNDGTSLTAYPHFYLAQGNDARPRVIYTWAENQPPSGSSTPLRAIDLNVMETLSPKDIWLDGIIPSEAVSLLQTHMKRILRRFLSYKRYEPALLYRTRDFKTLVHLLYVRRLAGEMGIATALDPVLSFPLGANAVSITEAARAYHTMMTGEYYPLSGSADPAMVPIITKIVDREGELIWQYQPQPRQLISKRVTASLSEILRMVMTSGTGKVAKDAVNIMLDIEGNKIRLPVPTFGKTGTANRFTNSSFVGLVPDIDGHTGQFDARGGYVIASYVGYDDNRPMKGQRVTIYGSSGALPLWVDTANAVVNRDTYVKNIPLADLTFGKNPIGISSEPGFQPITISPVTGLPAGPEDEKESLTWPKVFSEIEVDGKSLRFNRHFEPLSGDDHEKGH